MATARQSVFSFLKVSESLSTIDPQNLQKIRSSYAQMIDASPRTTTTTGDNPLKSLAQMYALYDDATNLDHLNLCVTCSSLERACEAIYEKYVEAFFVMDQYSDNINLPSTPLSAKNTSTNQTGEITAVSAETESLSRVICEIVIKKNQSPVIDFIYNFLLCPLANTGSVQK